MRASLWTTMALVATIAAGCGGNGPSTVPQPDNSLLIRIVGQSAGSSFDPNPAAAGGASVRFRNDTSDIHRIVLNDGSVDTGDIAPGATSRTVTMPATGTNYHCDNHPGMIGQVSGSGGGEPPPCTGFYCTGY